MKRIVTLVLLVATLSSCIYRPSTKSRYRLQAVRSSSTNRISDNYQSNDKTTSANAKFSKRIVTYDATLSMTVKDPDSTNNKLKSGIDQFGGYIQTLGTTKSIIRVKADSLNYAILWLSGLGKIDQKTVNGYDITEKYLDVEIRLENAIKARQRYLELLGKAENVEAALKVEKELERLNTEIDNYMGKKMLYDHQSQYSTITIYYSKKKKLGILGSIGVGIYKGFKWLIVRN